MKLRPIVTKLYHKPVRFNVFKTLKFDLRVFIALWPIKIRKVCATALIGWHNVNI